MIESWHWLAFGMLLVLAEIFLPSFTAIWFGLGACLVALISYLFPDSPLRLQILIWAFASTLATYLWFKYFRKTMKDRTNAGIAQEAIRGETGYVLKAPTGDRHGLARFTPALLGDDEWPFIILEDENSNEAPLREGDKVIVQNITGNTLIVTKKLSSPA